jgi:hypothetical protein
MAQIASEPRIERLAGWGKRGPVTGLRPAAGPYCR